MTPKYLILITLTLASILSLKAQNQSNSEQLVARIDTFFRKMPPEKLFIHTDKNFYTAGDTIWFKGYLENVKPNSGAAQSKFLYLELVSDSSITISRTMVPVFYGISAGYIPLQLGKAVEGTYTLRGYTNWMRNFGVETFFSKRFYISNGLQQGLIVKEEHQIENGNQLKLNLHFFHAENKPTGLKDMELRLLNGKNTVARKSVKTTPEGTIETILDISGNSKNGLTLIAQDKFDPKRKVAIPISVNSGNIDMQFLPESGHLVANLPNKVGFKALTNAGLGANVEGAIYNSKDELVTNFRTFNRGMGTAVFTPATGEKYYAKLINTANTKTSYPLPEVKPEGTILHLHPSVQPDTLRLVVYASPGVVNGSSYQLLAMANGQVYYKLAFKLNKQAVNLRLPVGKLPSGIIHLTLFDPLQKPVNERLAFIHQQDQLDIELQADKNSYNTRSEIKLALKAYDQANAPVAGSFSIAVTDDSMVKTDSLEDNILTRSLLTSALKGNIEDPAFYFGKSDLAKPALDVLLLTQGWVGYDWGKMLGALKSPEFALEKELQVEGVVLNNFGKPVSNSKITMLATSKGSAVMQGTTNKQGEFKFVLPSVEQASYVIQSTRASGGRSGLEIRLKEQKPPYIKPAPYSKQTPWYVNPPDYIFNYITSQQKINRTSALRNGVLLSTVVISSSAGQSGQIIDQEALEKEAKLSLFDFLTKNVKGFGPVTRIGKTTSWTYTGSGRQTIITPTFGINGIPARITIDGMGIRIPIMEQGGARMPGGPGAGPSQMQMGNQLEEFAIRDVLTSIYAEDATMISISRQMVDEQRVDPSSTDALDPSVDAGLTSQTVSRVNTTPSTTLGNREYVINISTRSGNGPFTQRTPGMATYKPTPLVFAKKFYSPKYTSANRNRLTPDLRSTVFWNADLLTDKYGKTETSFFSADKPGTYTVIVQGSDMNGMVGYQTQKIKIEK